MEKHEFETNLAAVKERKILLLRVALAILFAPWSAPCGSTRSIPTTASGPCSRPSA